MQIKTIVSVWHEIQERNQLTYDLANDNFLGCVSDGLCLGKVKAENPYFRIQDTHANVRLAGSGSSVNSKCVRPDGPYFYQNDNNLEEQNSVPKLNKLGKISMIGEETQTFQPSDDSSPKSIASVSLTSASNDEESEFGIKQSDLGQTKVRNTDPQQFIDVTKRSENRSRKRFSVWIRLGRSMDNVVWVHLDVIPCGFLVFFPLLTWNFGEMSAN